MLCVVPCLMNNSIMHTTVFITCQAPLQTSARFATARQRACTRFLPTHVNAV
jgi:hypothetical protein